MPTDATIYPYPSFTTLDAFGSNKVTKSPVPPMNAPCIAANAIDVSILTSLTGCGSKDDTNGTTEKAATDSADKDAESEFLLKNGKLVDKIINTRFPLYKDAPYNYKASVFVPKEVNVKSQIPDDDLNVEPNDTFDTFQIEDNQPQSFSELLESAFSELANLQSFISNPSAQISQSATAAPQSISLPKAQSAASSTAPKSITVTNQPKVSSIDNAAMFMMQSKITSLKI